MLDITYYIIAMVGICFGFALGATLVHIMYMEKYGAIIAYAKHPNNTFELERNLLEDARKKLGDGCG